MAASVRYQAPALLVHVQMVMKEAHVQQSVSHSIVVKGNDAFKGVVTCLSIGY
jgi:hypothetical protein